MSRCRSSCVKLYTNYPKGHIYVAKSGSTRSVLNSKTLYLYRVKVLEYSRTHKEDDYSNERKPMTEKEFIDELKSQKRELEDKLKGRRVPGILPDMIKTLQKAISEAEIRLVLAESEDNSVERDAFHAGWMANAGLEMGSETLRKAEEVDWLEYKKRGVTDYVNLLKAEYANEE